MLVIIVVDDRFEFCAMNTYSEIVLNYGFSHSSIEIL